MSVNRLPDEILQIILQHVLLDPDPRLICTTLSPAQWDYTLMFQFIAPRDVVRARSLLQVSKRWNPIVLQFLYACVIISKVHHASDVITRVKSEPVLGRRIKSLWMHAGNLQLWTDIVSHTHKITLVYLNIDALEGSEEIARAFLTSLNPETVYLHWTQRRGQPWISSVLLACVRMFWTNMRHLYLNKDFIDLNNLLECFRTSNSPHKLEKLVVDEGSLRNAKARLGAAHIDLVSHQNCGRL